MEVVSELADIKHFVNSSSSVDETPLIIFIPPPPLIPPLIPSYLSRFCRPPLYRRLPNIDDADDDDDDINNSE